MEEWQIPIPTLSNFLYEGVTLLQNELEKKKSTYQSPGLSKPAALESIRERNHNK